MRKTDSNPDKCYFRAGDRFSSHDGQWWFGVRDGDEQGPFPSRQAAEAALARYIDSCEMLDHLKDTAPAQSKPDAPPLSIDTSY